MDERQGGGGFQHSEDDITRRSVDSIPHHNPSLVKANLMGVVGWEHTHPRANIYVRCLPSYLLPGNVLYVFSEYTADVTELCTH